jgi:hypothetical protein
MLGKTDIVSRVTRNFLLADMTVSNFTLHLAELSSGG